MFALKILTFLWPFLKEMVLGGKTVKESYKTNPKAVFALWTIAALIALNVATIWAIIKINSKYYTLENEYKVAITTKPITEVPVPATPEKPVVINTVELKDPPKPPPERDDRYRDLKGYFDAIKAREDKERH